MLERQAAYEVALGTAVQDQEAAKVEQAIDIVKQLKAINAASVQILHEARQAGNQKTALKAVDRQLERASAAHTPRATGPASTGDKQLVEAWDRTG